MTNDDPVLKFNMNMLMTLCQIHLGADRLKVVYRRSGNFCVNKLSYDKFLCIKNFRRNDPLPC